MRVATTKGKTGTKSKSKSTKAADVAKTTTSTPILDELIAELGDPRETWTPSAPPSERDAA